MAENLAQTEVLLSINQLVFELKLNKNTSDYLVHKYKDGKFSLKDWKNKLKKDKLTY